MQTTVILLFLAAVYLTTNLVLPLIPVSPVLGAYLLQPICWGLFILAMRFSRGTSPIAKPSRRKIVLQLSLAIAFAQLIALSAGGLVDGFGRNPSSLTPLGMLEIALLEGTLLLGMEIGRTKIIESLGKRRSSVALILTSVVFALLAVPFGQIKGFQLSLHSSDIVISSWAPFFAESLLASVLVIQGGMRASLIYRAVLAAFWWLCPIIPDLQWGLKALIGVGVPIAGLILINGYCSYYDRRTQPKKHAKAANFPTGWVVTGLSIVVIGWFVVGVFPLKPALVGSGSMSPVFNTGDVVVISKVSAGAIKQGDVIEYRKEDKTNVIHRVIAVNKINGAASFITKGDANNAADALPVDPQNVEGKVVMVVPKIGWISVGIRQLVKG
jgi:signal peptidase I